MHDKILHDINDYEDYSYKKINNNAFWVIAILEPKAIWKKKYTKCA